MLQKLQELLDGAKLDLPAGPNFRAATHVWSTPEINALKLALAAQRPLLVRGEPGSGKSQLARAAAKVLEVGEPLVEVVHPRLEASDLLYRFDAMARMLDAQLGKEGQWDPSNERYVEHGLLWRALDRARAGQLHPVVLIDEIDKADADVPNSLLDVLGNRSFDVPMLAPDRRRVQADETFAPLVIFTTNEERELPAAFVRRCVVLNLNPPIERAALRQWMYTRAEAHAKKAGVVTQTVVLEAIEQTLDDRAAAALQGFPKVGLAEAIDLIEALGRLTSQLPESDRQKEQQDLLDKLSAYALVKYPLSEPGQARAPRPRQQTAANG